MPEVQCFRTRVGSSVRLFLLTLLLLSLPKVATAFRPHSTASSLRTATCCCNAVSRRDVLEGTSQAAWLLASQPAEATITTSSSTKHKSNEGLMADLPMIRLRLPRSALGREYLAVPLYIQGKGPFEFMVDTGLTTELITPHLQAILDMNGKQDEGKRSRLVQGISAGGVSTNALIELKDVSLSANTDAGDTDTKVVLPTLHAVVTDFPQEHIDPLHDPIEGMVGMEFLSLFDVEIDFPNNRLRLYRPGQAPHNGMVEIPAAVINETGLLAMRVTTPGAKHSILGLLDCGSTFSAINWAATTYLGLPTQPTDTAYKNGPSVSAVGVDGRQLTLPIIQTQLSFAGEVILDLKTQKPTSFARPPTDFKPWQAVTVAVGDLPAFAQALGDGIKPYAGPAALIGLDILSQRRIVFETPSLNDRTRQRRLWVSPK